MQRKMAKEVLGISPATRPRDVVASISPSTIYYKSSVNDFVKVVDKVKISSRDSNIHFSREECGDSTVGCERVGASV